MYATSKYGRQEIDAVVLAYSTNLGDSYDCDCSTPYPDATSCRTSSRVLAYNESGTQSHSANTQ